MQYLHTKIALLTDPGILKLIDEVQRVTGVHSMEYRELPLLQFLQMCLHPHGGSFKPVKITKEMIDGVDATDSFLLRKQAGKTEDALHRLLADLARLLGKSVESFPGTSVFMLLNKACLMPKKRK